MLSGLIDWSLSNRALVIALFVLMGLGGLYAATSGNRSSPNASSGLR